jgi:hypothetical protein
MPAAGCSELSLLLQQLRCAPMLRAPCNACCPALLLALLPLLLVLLPSGSRRFTVTPAPCRCQLVLTCTSSTGAQCSAWPTGGGGHGEPIVRNACINSASICSWCLLIRTSYTTRCRLVWLSAGGCCNDVQHFIGG